jgi:hypothetical protein
MVAFREKKQEEESKQQKRSGGAWSCARDQEKVAQEALFHPREAFFQVQSESIKPHAVHGGAAGRG